jgi:hypothetical protein
METRGNPPHFLRILKDVYEAKNGDRTNSNTAWRHNPSSASIRRASGRIVGSCLRRLFYKTKGIEPTQKRDLTNDLQADFGNAIHKVIQDRLAESKEIKITPELAGRIEVDGLTQELSYRMDGLVNYHGEEGILEIKSVQSFFLTRMIKETGGPKEADVLQVLSYFGANPDLKWAALLYFGRDTAFRTEHHLIKEADGSFTLKNITPLGQTKKLDPELNYENIKARWKELEEAVEKDEVPKRDYKVVLGKEGQIVPKRTKNHVDYKSDSACIYCPYAQLCWTGPDAVNDAYKISGE